jgi:hypothetical protein
MREMRTQFKKWLALICMAFALKTSMFAQNGPCTPLPQPAWITVTNITASSAQVQWENVQAGAWYRVELRNLNTGLVEDLSIIQANIKNYYTLSAGTNYRVTVQASSCQQGPFGQGLSAEFETPGIVVDDIVFINQEIEPNKQIGFNNANTVSPTNGFFICLKQGTIPISDLNDVLHAYIKPKGSGNDFFEFFMAAKTGSNDAYFDSAPLRYPREKWAFLGIAPPQGPGQNPNYLAVEVKHLNANNNWEVAMRLEVTTLVSPPGYVMLRVIMNDNYVFVYDENRQSQVCDPEAEASKAPDHNPTTFLPKDQLRGIFPNPFTDHLNVLEFDQDAGPVTLRVVDATGRLLFETAEEDATKIVRRINTADWQPGFYFLQIQTGTGATTTPLVKM